MTEHRVPSRPEEMPPVRGRTWSDRPGARPMPTAFEPAHAAGRAPVRRVRPSAAPGQADFERYLRYLKGPTAFGA